MNANVNYYVLTMNVNVNYSGQGFDDGLNTVWHPGPGHPEGKAQE